LDRFEYKTLNDRAYEAIKKGLMAAEFGPGQALIIRTLAANYGISTTPVREALQRLVAERLLELLPNRTIAVPELNSDKFVEILRIRCALEGLAAELGAQHVEKADIRKLKKLLRTMETALNREDYDSYRSVNREFHFTLYDRAGAPQLLQIIQDMWGQAGPYMKVLFADGRYKGMANDEHRRIINALEVGDVQSVRGHIVIDVESACRIILQELAGASAQ
jgi:DNA-binding GntR family transcriptional regulator